MGKKLQTQQRRLGTFVHLHGSSFIIVYGLLGYEPLTYEDYVYPMWANVLGWCIAGSSVLMIPAVAVIQILITPGTLLQRLKILTTPWRDHQTVLARSMSMNGIQTDPAQIRLTTPQATEAV